MARARTERLAASAPAAPGATAAILRVLRHRQFGPYFAGNLLSNTGTWFQNIAQSLLVYRLTGSVFLVGLVNFAQFAGVLVFASWAGMAADRFDRRRLIIATQAGAVAITAALATIAAAGRATAAIVIALALALGLTTAFATPALKALVPTLVEREYVPAAVTMDSVTFNLARVLGPILGVAVVAALGIPWAFALNSLSYLALILALLIVRPITAEARRPQRPRLRDSVALVAADRRLLLLMLAIAACALSADPVNTLGPAFATRVYHRPDTLLGYLVGAFGAGAVIGAFLSVRPSGTPFRRIAITLGLMTAGTVLFGLTSPLAIGLIALLAAGFGYLASQTSATTLVQLTVEDAQRGRVMALWSVAFLGMRPIASLLDGALADLCGIRAAAVLMAAPVALSMIAIAWLDVTGATI